MTQRKSPDVLNVAKSVASALGIKSSFQRLIEKCNQSFEAHDYTQALKLLEDGRRDHPDRPYLSYLTGYFLEQLGRYAEAIPHLEKAQSEKVGGDTEFRLGHAYIGAGRFQDAYTQFRQTDLSDPSRVSAKRLVIDCAMNFSGGLGALVQEGLVSTEDIYLLVPLHQELLRRKESILTSLPPETIEIRRIETLGSRAVDMVTGITDSRMTSLSVLENVTIFGRSDLIFDLENKKIFCDIFDYPQGSHVDLKYNSMIVGHSDSQAVVDFNDKKQVQFPKAIIFLSATAREFGHWFYEHLPRLEVLLKYSSLDGIPILIDDGMHANHLALLQKVIGTRFPIQLISADTQVHLNKAYILSSRVYTPPLLRLHYPPSYQDAPVAPSVLTFLRKSIGKQLPSQKLKLYMARRNSTWRKLVNEEEIIQLLIKKGFQILEPEKMSFESVLNLIAQAEIIIGPSGSAMNNVTFAAPGTRVIFLSPPSVGNYVSFLSSLNQIGIRSVFFCGESPDSQALKHSSFVIPVKKFEQALEKFSATVEHDRR